MRVTRRERLVTLLVRTAPLTMVLLAAIPVTLGGTTGNFDFIPGGSISGTVTNAGTGAPVAIGLIVYDSTGIIVDTPTSDASGNYTATGLPAGNYFVVTNPDAATQNYVTQLYNGISYDGLPTTGTPVAVTVGTTHTGVDFALTSGGSLSGTVTATGTGDPLAGVQIAVYLPTGRVVKFGSTDAAGSFTITGLQAGTYNVSTNVPELPAPFYIDEVYNNVPCLGCVMVTTAALPNVTISNCGGVTSFPGKCLTPAATGAPVVVTNGTTRTGVDFALATGAGIISGAVTDAATGLGLVNVAVSVYNGANYIVKTVTTDAAGAYTVRGLTPGNYYARTIVSPATPYYRDEAYGNVPCLACNVRGTPGFVVAANTVATADFALGAGSAGAVTGTVMAEGTGVPLNRATVDIYLPVVENAFFLESTFSDSAGTFEFDALPAGSYYAVARGASNGYHDERYLNIECHEEFPPHGCDPAGGTAIVVTNGATHSGIDFTLTPGMVKEVMPNTGSQGQGPFDVVITGDGYTHFVQGTTVASFGAGITVNSTTLNGGWRANITIAVDASPGPRTVTMTTGSVVAQLVNGFTVLAGTPAITLAPNLGQQGQADLNVGVTGSFTNFAPGLTTASFGPGITVNSTTVQTATQATVNITIAADAALGPRTVTMTTGAEVVTSANGFGVAVPSLTAVSPRAGRRTAANLIVTLTGQLTHFVQGITTTDFGAGILVNSTTVQSATQAMANITISVGAALGSRTVTATTGGEVATLPGGFLVTPASVTRGDFDGDGKSEVAVFRPSTGVWYVRGVSTTAWGGGADIPVAADYDGDGRIDHAVYRPSSGTWFILQTSTATGSVTTWGGGADIPVPGDYDGDGRTDIAVFRPSTGVWYVLQSSAATGSLTTWGGGADVPVVADYDGDGKADIAVFRPSTGVWYVLQSSTSTGSLTTWGGTPPGFSADIPVAADYDGDGKADIAVFRRSTGVWYVLQSSTATGSLTNWGGGADIPVPGDYDGDGKTDIAVFRASTGNWYIINSSTGTGAIVTWGGVGDIPVLKRP